VAGDPLAVVALLARQLAGMSVDHYMVGSLASSLYGVPRSTQDADLVAAVPAGEASRFAAAMSDALSGEFYIDEEAVRDAVAAGASFNVIHLGTMFKADVFMAGADNWSRSQMQRARVHEIAAGTGTFSIKVASPEDTILHKLHWFRLGDETSERQWTDVLGVIRIQGDLLDAVYLDRFAAALGVSDLLRRARDLAGSL
jgi:hypothetical protein